MVVLANDFMEIDTVRWTSDPVPQPIWGSTADQEEAGAATRYFCFVDSFLCSIVFLVVWFERTGRGSNTLLVVATF